MRIGLGPLLGSLTGLSDMVVRTQRWPFFAALAAAAMLATAHAFERYGGLAPCALCLRQREVYWGVLALAGAALAARLMTRSTPVARAFDVLLGLAFLTGCVVAVYHAGAEWKFWPGPQTCSATPGAVIAAGQDLLAALARPTVVVPCDEAAWRMLGLSMAGWNALVSAGLAIMSFMAASASARREALSDDQNTEASQQDQAQQDQAQQDQAQQDQA